MTIRCGFAKYDITPRIGVELYGFGPFLNRISRGVRDILEARAAAFECDGKKVVLITCDLCMLRAETCAKIREIVRERVGGLEASDIMISASHTHSGPADETEDCGWGAPDFPYLETLPCKIAEAGIRACQCMEEMTLSTALVPCRHIGYNRLHNHGTPLLEDVLREEWEPEKPELTDTMCRVIRFDGGTGTLKGFLAYFGCHPVVCCAKSHFIHGDYPGVAMHNLMREYPGSIGLFLQGAHGDVNTGCVHKEENESLLALDVFAVRFADAVRTGLSSARSITADRIRSVSRTFEFSTRMDFTMEHLLRLREECECLIHSPSASDADDKIRMKTVYLRGIRKMIAFLESGRRPVIEAEVQGIRLGPLALLGAPFEIMQAIKNDVMHLARSEMPMVMSLCNGSSGYAPDREQLGRALKNEHQNYEALMVPLINGRLPYSDIHDELVRAFLAVDGELHA